MDYQTSLQGWHDFYSIAGMAAGSLVGLLFVGLSLHLRVVVSRADVRGLARVTLTSFGLVLVLALFMVIPEHDPGVTGLELICSGGAACLLIAPAVRAVVRSRVRTIDYRRLLLRFGLSTAAYLGVIATGGLIASGAYARGFGWLVAVVVVLLLISLRNSWDLLVSVGAATLEDQSAVTDR
jgi:hypothetical protein